MVDLQLLYLFREVGLTLTSSDGIMH